MTVYASELATITQKLQAYSAATGAKLLFAITSPMCVLVACIFRDRDRHRLCVPPFPLSLDKSCSGAMSVAAKAGLCA